MAMKPNLLFHPTVWLLLFLAVSAPMLSGCAAALIGAGAVGGYAVAKDMEDGQLIDSPRPKDNGNKGWFSGGGK